MIDKYDIIKLSRLTAIKPFQQEKNYIQTMMLRSIYTYTSDLIFKGGTSLFFFYRLPRFSEDLDFTLINPINENKIIKNIEKDLMLIGIENKLKNKTLNEISSSYRFSVKGPLYTSDVSGLTVKIDISKREEIFIKPKIMKLNSLYNDVLPFNAVVMDLKEITSEKIRSIMTRNKARDVFDLYFLLKNYENSINIELVNKKLRFYNEEFSMSRFITELNKKSPIWKSELNSIIIGKVPDINEVILFITDALKESL
ncbi:MAG: nucleotidyl transferase AbiEii/AbiGii toxin family protein [Thermoplasmataceae archaeon]